MGWGRGSCSRAEVLSLDVCRSGFLVSGASVSLPRGIRGLGRGFIWFGIHYGSLVQSTAHRSWGLEHVRTRVPGVGVLK